MHLKHAQGSAQGRRTPSDARPLHVYNRAALGDLLQRRVTQQQALLLRTEAHLRHSLIAATLNGQHAALAELGVAHGIANRQGRDFLPGARGNGSSP